MDAKLNMLAVKEKKRIPVAVGGAIEKVLCANEWVWV